MDARKRLQNGAFDVVVSDVNMPGYGGLEFLRNVRERDLDVPVVLVTGKPAVDSSIRAVEYGAFRYLIKPVPNDTLVEVIRHAVRFHKLARLKRQALELQGGAGRLGERAALEGRFASGLERMLVRGVDTDSKRQSIIRSMKTLCDELKMLVVAEGIETPGERDMLAELGCDLFQGYLFARPERGFPVPRW
ncbi:MAG TPA: response regulator [Polyangiaceae bacterium]|nr:response regulator [Polyangiaceae bacterium]